MTQIIDIRQALIDRMESDRRWGLSHVPISPMQMSQSAVAMNPGVAAPQRPAYPLHATQFERRPVAAPTSAPIAAPIAPPPPLPAAERSERLTALKVLDDNEVKGCEKCGLAKTRTKTVFGVGDVAARILFVGEAPGHDEDISGIPFVGRAGQLLTDMIEKGMGLKRDDVYICNVLKCRPPNNRNPALDEVAACKGYLMRQIELIRPQVIIALGASAAQTLLNSPDSIGRLRSRWHDFYPSGTATIGEPIPLMATYHPSYLLRDPGEKKKAWADLKMVMARLGIPIPDRN